MTKSWQTTPLSDLIKVHHGFAFPSDACGSAIANEPRLIRIGDFARTSQSDFQPSRVQGYFAEYQERFRLSPGDLLLAMTCQSADGEILGVCMRVPNDGVTYLHNQRIGRVEVLRPELLDTRFLEFAFRTREFNRHLFNSASGSKILHTAPDRILTYLLDLPPLDEQRRIAGVLGALDDLIEVNRGLAIDCSDLAESLWIEATSTSHSEMVLADCANVILGGTPSRKEPGFWGGQVPWLNSGEANEFRVIKPSECITDLGYSKSSTKMMPVGATIVAITGATLGQISRLEISACGNQSLVGVWSDSPAMNDFIFFGIRNRIEVLMQSATGGAQQHVNKANVEELRLPWLTDARIQAWHVAAQPLMKATAELLFEAETLMTTRDELLPLLMSGRIRVGEDVAA